MTAYLLAFIALSAGVTTNTESSILTRLFQLDLGFKQTLILLDTLGDESSQVTAADIITLYNITTFQGPNNPLQQFYVPCIESTQYVLCQAYHTVAMTSLSLYSELVDDAYDFNKDQRNVFQDGFTNIFNENLEFVAKVAPYGLPLCFEGIQLDDSAVEKAFLKAFEALDPLAVAK
ncbi:hypothetical protein BDW59DRAFT_164829 [Aspergillus cavernicola]|uniref:Uncharacterized protein n=1 Tax=Aspergillus cavernicola TaxID=176166 RepID=A0ABR4HWP0_9EURO